MSFSNNFPTTNPTLELDFANVNALDPRITFTRANPIATVTNSLGLIQTVGANVPRFDYDPVTLAAKGLLIEEQRTNLFQYSEYFDDVAWSKGGATISADSTSSPNGNNNADRLVEDTSTGDHRTFQIASFTSGTAYTFSVYAKASGRNLLQLANTMAGGFASTFDLTAGTVTNTATGTATITNAGNGWYRCSVSNTSGVTGSSNNQIRLVDTGTNTSYTGNGTSGIFLFGAQLEAGAFPTSYIPTTTTALTRAADVANVNTLSPWYNASASTIYAEVAVPQLGRAARPWTVDDGSMSNIVDATISVANGFAVEAIAGGVYGGFAAATGLITANTTQKTAAVFTTSGNELACLNAGTVGSNAITLPSVSLTRLLLGRQDNGVALCGWLRRLTYYPRAFSAAELQAITS